MKKTICLFLFILTFNSYAFTDLKVGGVVTISKSLEKKLTPNGVLFIFAKKAGANAAMANGMPPMAVLKIAAPKFPQSFTLTPSNLIIAGTKFEGPMKVMARFSPSGDAISTPDSLEGVAMNNQNVEMGNTQLKIELKTKK